MTKLDDQNGNELAVDAGSDDHSITTGRRSKKKSLTERVYDQLRHDIVTCVYQPGAELSEAILAQRFEVSKTPVREALAMLRLDGLVITYPRLGYQVTPITFADINEAFDLRILLEVGAAKLACPQITAGDIEHLKELASHEDLLDQNSPLTEFILANRKFHMAIAEASRNTRLVGYLNKLLIEMDRFFYLGASLRDVRAETNDYHRQIIRALEQRDAQLASALLTRHNEDTRQGLIAALTRNPALSKVTL